MNSPKVQFQETDLTITPAQVVAGVSNVMLKTKGGPLGTAGVNTLITTWEQFQRVFGGFIAGSTDLGILKAKRALETGSALRVSRIVHYNTIGDASSFDAEFSITATSNIFTIAAALVAGQTITYTNGTAVSQLFDTDSTTTLRKLAAKIIAGFGDISTVHVVSGTKFIVVPAGADIAGDTAGVTGGTPPAVTRTTAADFKDSAGNTLFTVSPKYPGAWYNNLRVAVTAGSNGQPGYWDLSITFLGENFAPEIYRNLFITGSPTAGASTYLDTVIKKSKWLNVTYGDLSAIVANPITPVPFTLKMKTGSDGGAVTAADYIGDSAAKTGFYAFDGIDDAMQIAVLDDEILSGVHEAGAAYATNRKDLQYFAHIGEDGDAEADLIAEKDALGIDSSYVMFFGGMHSVVDPSDSVEKVISEIGDVIGLAAYSEKTFGPWLAFSGYNRGLIQNTLGAANQFGAAGNSANLDLLANHQINVVINRSNRTMLWGSFTGQLANSQLSLTNIRRFHIYLKKSLGPVLEQFLEEPCDIITFKKIYLSGKSFMDPLIAARAIFSYRWEGDQFASTPADFKVNDPDDVAIGKYLVRLFVKDIASMQEFSIDIVLTPSSVSFEDALILVQP